MFEISKGSDFLIDEIEVDQDHIHLLINFKPKTSILSIVSRLKSISTKRIWLMHENYLKSHFWKEHTFWSDGYFSCTTGDASTETIKNYIKEQG